jgi:type I restriction enzyme S subunit
VLFGRRNAYLRRTGIAPHDGLCSADIMILHPKENVISSEFLPFFINSDYFFDVAINLSTGSIMQRVMYSRIKDIEFQIPSLEEQKQLAKILWAFENTKQVYKKLIAQTDDVKQAKFMEMFGDPEINPKGWQTKRIEEVAECISGLSYKKENVSSQGVIVLRSGNVLNYRLDFNDIVRVNCYIPDDLFVRDNDILMSTANTFTYLGKTALIKDINEEMTFGTFMSVIRSEIFTYLFNFFQTNFFRDKVSSVSSGAFSHLVTLPNNFILGFSIPIPPLDIQQEFAEFTENIDNFRQSIETSLTSLESTMKEFIGRIYVQ